MPVNPLRTLPAAALIALAASFAPPLNAAAPDAAAIDDCDYPDAAAAARAWEPMHDTQPVAVATVAGRKALRMPCVFAGAKGERASWDRKGAPIDLAGCRGIKFDVFCTNTSPVSGFVIYLQSGGGWYTAPFHPETPGAWNTVTIDKASTRTEGTPAGWGAIKTIRVSAWRGGETDTEFYVARFRKTGLLGADAAVAVVRAESASRRSPGSAEDYSQYTETIVSMLDAQGVPCGTISDIDLTAERLAKARLAILPYNPSLPEPAAEALRQFCAAGGKLLAFYSFPSQLRPILNLGPMSHTKADPPGRFSAIRLAPGGIVGAPPVVGQRSWNINALASPPDGVRVLAEWLDDKGQPSGSPAIVGTSNALFMTHVLLPDDPSNKRRMLFAMAAHLAPDLWPQAARAAIARIGRVGRSDTFEKANDEITKLAEGDKAVLKALDGARELRESAQALVAKKLFSEAIVKAAAAERRTVEAFCMAPKPAKGEFRAFWCHSAFGVAGMNWDEAIRRLADNGFTAILPNMLWGGAAFYPSSVLPVQRDVAAKGDQIAQCLAACRKHGVQLHVWKVNWNLGHYAPREFADRMRAAGRLQASNSGKQEDWLCPSHPENQKLEIDAMLEVVRNYDVDGVHFDYIRYPGGSHCFCPGCRERFQKAAGLTLQNWPADVLKDGPHRQAWLDWRRSHINTVVQAVAQQARALKPKIKISAAVFRNWPSDRDSVGQDWKLWCDNGWVDFLCPMDYTPSNSTFENMVARQLEWAGRVPCYPGIGVSTWPVQAPDRVIEQIQTTRRLHTGGFTIFNYSAPEANDLLPLLGLGITAKR